MLVFRLALRALAWRASASATVFVVALVGVIAAGVGPIYLHAVDETVLAERLADAPQTQRDLRVTRATLIGTGDINWTGPVASVANLAADRRWFDTPVFSEEAQVVYRSGRTRYATQLAAVDDLCTHVRVVAGRCVDAGTTDETVISARTARSQQLGVGDVIEPVPASGGVQPIPLRVVGIIAPIAVHGTYWRPWNYFNAEGAYFDTQLPRLDSFFVDHRALAARVNDLQEQVSANVHLRVAAIRLDDLSALRAHLRRVQDAAAATVGTALTHTSVGNELADVLNGMHREMSLARTLIVLPTLQLVLLAIFVLYAIVAGTAAVQGPEVALAKLRGRRRGSVLLQGILQPAVLIVLAAPCAALLAWLVVRLTADQLLGRHVAIAYPLSAVAVVAAATGGGLLAVLVAARRIVNAPVGTLLRRGSDTTGSSLGLALADAAAVALALAGLVELIAGGVLDSGQTDPLSALAPTLLAVAASVIVLRTLPFAGRAVLRWTRDSRRLAAFLAVRQIVRRPAGARVLLLVGVALALAAFAVTNWSVARTNRELRALNNAGASTVFYVAPGPDVYDLRAAVDRADPGGHSTAAAVVRVGGSTPLLAVDTKRYAGVGAWQRGYSSASLHDVLATLAAPQPPPIAFAGTRLRLDIDVTAAPRGGASVTAFVTGADHRRTGYDAGPVQPGRHTYELDLAPICGSAGCRVTGLAVQPAVTPPVTNPLTRPEKIRASVAAQVLRGGQWRAVDGFGRPQRWRDDGQGIVAITSGQGGALQVEIAQAEAGGAWPQLLSADVPAHLPAVLASGTAGAYPGPAAHDASSFGLDAGNVAIDGRRESVTLPQLDRYGVMVDFGLALQAMSGTPAAQTQLQVWLNSSAPADMAARLARGGVRVTRVVHAATYRTALDHTGPAFAGGLFLVAAVAATLLAVGATVLVGVTTARRRAYELAALEAAGLAPRVLRRAIAAEQVALLGLGLLVGLAAGLGGSVLALRSTPFFVDESVGPPPEHDLPIGLLATLTGCLIAVFALTGMMIARIVSRQATMTTLREAQQ